MSTFIEARAELLARGFDGLRPARGSRCVNLGIRRVCAAALWPFMRTIQHGAALPYATDDVRHVAGVHVEGREGQGPLPFLHHVRDPTVTGTAVGWTFTEDGIQTVPLEAGLTGRIDFYRLHPWLTEDDDDLLVPDEFLDVVLDAACIEASKDLREWESVAGFKTELNEGLGRMMEALIDPQSASWEIIEIPAGY